MEISFVSLNVSKTNEKLNRTYVAGYAIINGTYFATINGKINVPVTNTIFGSHYGEVGLHVETETGKTRAMEKLTEYFKRNDYA